MAVRHKRRALWAAPIALLVLASTGCAADAELPTNTAATTARAYPDAPLLDQIVDCMNDRGWEVIIDWQGGYSGPEMNSKLADQWVAASNECAEAAGYFDPQLSTEQIRELYLQEVATHECIVALGEASDQPPSEQAFIDTYGSGEQYFAIAEVLAAQLPMAETQRIAQECVPPTWFLNVSGL